MTERSGVVTNAAVTRDHDHEGGRFAEGCRRRQMNGVQSTDGFDRKGASSMGEDRVSHAHNMTTAGKSLKSAQRCSLLLRRDASREVSAKHGAACFGNCYSGRDPLSQCPD